MNPAFKKLDRELSRSQLKMGGNARVLWFIGCPATPDPSPSVSLRDSSNAGEGSGLLDSMKCDAGVKEKEEVRLTMSPPVEKCDGGRSKSVTPPASHTPFGVWSLVIFVSPSCRCA